MKITEVNIPWTFNDGLERIKMKKLEDIVLIVGKNGSGKTRLLNKIKNYTEKKPIKELVDEILNRGTMEELLFKKEELEKKSDKDYDDLRDITRIEADMKELENLNSWNYIITSELADKYKIVEFVPKNLELLDPNTLSRVELEGYASSLDRLGFETYHECVFAKIQYLQDLYINATHSETTIRDEDKKNIVNEYKRLQNFINTFLNTDLTRSEEGYAELFDLQLGKTRLSDGQKILLQFCLAIYTQVSSLNDLIIFMDEPENHLHPSAILDVIDVVKSKLSNGQIWIATHSINILSHFDPSLIWYIENGEISYVGRMPDKVLSGIVGNDDEIEKFSEFLSLPAQFAMSRFAHECLMAPKTIDSDGNDPQVEQIKNATVDLHSRQDKIRILDLGAGKGRLLSSVYESGDIETLEISKWLDYIAFDLDEKDKLICIETIYSVYKSQDKRYYNDKAQLLSDYNGNSFDMIVMCNVLHEIHPKEWLQLFSDNDIIMKLLKDDGILLILEDQLIPVGEKAYTKGFLVLDEPEFKYLLKLTEDEKYNVADAREDGRLKAHFIPKEYLKRIDINSIKIALSHLNKRAKDKVIELRSQSPSYKNGRLHGFWIQQYANSQFVIDEIETI